MDSKSTTKYNVGGDYDESASGASAHSHSHRSNQEHGQGQGHLPWSGYYHDVGGGQVDYSATVQSGPVNYNHGPQASYQLHNQQQQHGQELDESRNGRNLIVNYLPQNMTDRDLYDLFISYGNIENARVMKDRKTGYSFGYGFVNFTQEIEATEAINGMNGRRIDNKVLKVSLARPSSEEIKDTNLYVSNLRRDITDADLRVMFSPFGEIVQQNILQDKYTGMPRGVAFVRFGKREQANAALEAMNDFVPEGCTDALHVKLAENHGKQKAAYVAGFQAGYYQGGPRF